MQRGFAKQLKIEMSKIVYNFEKQENQKHATFGMKNVDKRFKIFPF